MMGSSLHFFLLHTSQKGNWRSQPLKMLIGIDQKFHNKSLFSLVREQDRGSLARQKHLDNNILLQPNTTGKTVAPPPPPSVKTEWGALTSILIFCLHQVIMSPLNPLLGWCQTRPSEESGHSSPLGGNEAP